MIRETIVKHVLRSNQSWQLALEAEAEGAQPRLAVSGIGQCPRAIFLDACQSFPESEARVGPDLLVHRDPHVELTPTDRGAGSLG